MAQRRRKHGGFTMIEVMVSLLLSAIAVIGIIGLYRVTTRSSSYSRRSTEAAVLAGDKMEVLRATATPTDSAADEELDAGGMPIAGGPYKRRWFIETVPSTSPTHYDIIVEVDWDDDGTTRKITMRSSRRI